MADEEKSDLKQSSDKLWNNVKDTIENIFDRDISSQEFYYLLSLYPYLEICDADYPYLDEGVQPTIVDAENGWKIFDFDSVISSGAYELFCRPASPKEDDEEGGGETGSGTLVKQYSDVAFEMIALAMKKGWTGAEIVSGFYPMQRMAWIAACEKGYELKGFDPTPEDYVVQSWVTRIREGKLYPPEKPFMVGGGSGKGPKRK